MSRMRRVHRDGGVYFVVLEAADGQAICIDEADYVHVLRLISRSVQQSHAFLLAYCCTPRELRLIIKVAAIPLGRCIQQIAMWQSRFVHQRSGETGRLFRDRYRAVLIPVRDVLPGVVRCVHRSPLELSLAADWAHYPWSSHSVYATGKRMRGLHTGLILRLLTTEVGQSREAYLRFMEEGGGGLCRKVSGELPPFWPDGTCEQWLTWLTAQTPKEAVGTSIEAVIDVVARSLDVNRKALLAGARGEKFTLARALITRYATCHRIASVAEIKRILGRSKSSLYSAVQRCKVSYPELFDSTAVIQNSYYSVAVARKGGTNTTWCADGQVELAGSRM